MKIYKSKYCELDIVEEVDTLCEIWHIASCPVDEFKKICDTILKNCIEYHIKNLIIDASGAISYLLPENQEWLDREFNSRILYETEVKTIVLISPESLVTRISTDQFYDNITRNEHGIFTIKLKSCQEAVKWLTSRKNQSK